MKIVLLSPHFAPEFEGGTELVARAQAQALQRRGHEVHVVSGSELPHQGQDVVEQALGDLRVSFLPRLGEETYDLKLLRPRLAELVAELCQGADLVHLHHWSTLAGDLVRRLASGCPVVVSLHDLFVSCPRFFRVPHPSHGSCPEQGWDAASCVSCLQPDAGGMPPAALEAGLEARREGFQAELDAASRVLVPSQAHREELQRYVRLPAKTEVLPHGLCIELGRLAPLEIPARFTPEQPLRVLFLGHRTAVKGVEDLVDALAGLPEPLRASVHLTLLGKELDAGFDANLRARAAGLSMELGEPYVARELAACVERSGGAHLVALPSQVRESYGLVTDEALGLGLPVWVSDRGAPAERVGAAGKVLPGQDPAAWGRAFRQLLEEPDMLKEARRALPISPRSADNAAQDLEQIYAQLLSAH